MPLRLAALSLFFILSSYSSYAQSAQQESVGKVITVKGDVQLVRGKEKLIAQRKSELKQHDLVSTGEKARARFKFNDGTLTTLGENSEIQIDHYTWKKGEQKPQAEFTLIKGVFRTVTGLITKVDDPKFNVKTPMGSIGIRGTDFWGGYLNDDAIDVLFVEGEHNIEVSNEFGTVILEKPGQGTTITAGKAPSSPKTWPAAKVSRAVKTITID